MDFGRLLTAMVTPLNADESVNYDAAERLAHHLVEIGHDGIVVAGTTGESPTLTRDEKLTLFRVVKQAVGQKVKVVAGTGSYCTRESLELTREAEKAGVDGAMLVVPYYNNPPQEGLYQHFKTVAQATGLPIMLYNVPSRAPRNMEAATTLRLAEVPNIAAIKEASGKTDQATTIIHRAPAGFRVYSGDDAMTLPLMGVGAYGVVSVAGHIVGRQIKEMITHFVEGRTAKAAEIHGRLLPFYDACFSTTNPIPIKAAVNLLGIPAGGVRLPMVEADAKTIALMAAAMRDQGIEPK